MATTVEKKSRPDPVSRVSSRRSAPPAAPRSAPLSARPPQRSERSDRAQLSSESSQPSENPTPRVSNLTRGLAEAYGARGTERSIRSEGDETVRVGTYNIGAGNEEASTEENFQRTRELIADEIVHGGSEVINLQEVGVDGRLTGGRDNNQEILESVFVEELGDDWRDADLSRVSLDEDGKPVHDDDNQPVYDPKAYADTRVTATNDEGQRRNMDVTRQRYNDQGEPVDWSESPAQGHVVSYEAEAAPGKNYSLVFGSSSDGGT